MKWRSSAWKSKMISQDFKVNALKLVINQKLSHSTGKIEGHAKNTGGRRAAETGGKHDELVPVPVPVPRCLAHSNCTHLINELCFWCFGNLSSWPHLCRDWVEIPSRPHHSRPSQSMWQKRHFSRTQRNSLNPLQSDCKCNCLWAVGCWDGWIGWGMWRTCCSPKFNTQWEIAKWCQPRQSKRQVLNKRSLRLLMGNAHMQHLLACAAYMYVCMYVLICNEHLSGYLHR